MLRTIIFTLLFSASFLPNIEITRFVVPIEASIQRKVLGALFMGTMFFIIKGLMPFNVTRFLIQELAYFIGIYVFLDQGLKKSLQILVSMAILSATSEWAIISFLNRTQVGMENLLMIDSFYILTLFLNIAIMTAIAFILRHFIKHKEDENSKQFLSTE